jgi:hypothetical protein
MTSVFQRYNELLSTQRMSLRFWDGRPTGFAEPVAYEYMLLEALESNDVPALNVLIDEVGNGPLADTETRESVLRDFMAQVGEVVADSAFPAELEWYVTTLYPPLLLSFTPQLFLSSPDLQDAVASYPANVYQLQRWWQTLPNSSAALRVLSELFLPGTLESVSAGAPTLKLSAWQRHKKAQLLADRATQGYQDSFAALGVSSSSAAATPRPILPPPRTPQRQPRQLPPRQGLGYSAVVSPVPSLPSLPSPARPSPMRVRFA